MSENDLNARKKASQRRSKETISYLLEATARIIKKGSKLTTNHVANLAGVSIGSLYQYFPNKNALLKEFVEREIGKDLNNYFQGFKNISEEDLNTEDLIEKLVSHFCLIYQDKEKVFRFFFEKSFQWGLISSVFSAEDKQTTLIANILEKRSEDLRTKNVNLATFVVTQSILGVLRRNFLQSEAFNKEELNKELVILSKNYLLKN